MGLVDCHSPQTSHIIIIIIIMMMMMMMIVLIVITINNNDDNNSFINPQFNESFHICIFVQSVQSCCFCTVNRLFSGVFVAFTIVLA